MQSTETNPSDETASATGVVTESADVGDQGATLAIAGSKPVHPQPQSIEGLIALAIEHGAAVEPLERLMAMRQTLKAETAQEAFFEALSAFQSECPVIPKRKTAGQGNFTYRYAPLEDIVRITSPILRTHGLSYKFDTRFETNPPAQVVICTVHHRDGHRESSEFRTPVDASARMNDMQKSASAQTYAKRYAFCNAFGILTGDEDDDGRGAGGSRVNPEAATSAGSGDRHGQSSRERHVESPPPAPRPVSKNLVPLKRVSRTQDSDDESSASAPVATPASPTCFEQLVVDANANPASLAKLLDLGQATVENAAILEVAERRKHGLDPLPEDVVLKRARARCNDRLKTLYDKTLETASLMELEALGRIIDRTMAKLDGS